MSYPDLCDWSVRLPWLTWVLFPVQVFDCVRGHLYRRHGHHGCGAVRAGRLEDYGFCRNSANGYRGGQSPVVTVGT